MEKIRTPFQGTCNIVQFNWHFYLLSLLFLILLILIQFFTNDYIRFCSGIAILFIVLSTSVSLIVSWYIYDFSGLYKFSWLDNFHYKEKTTLVNINAGFDETSILLKKKFCYSDLIVYDFYDPLKHTEVSIKRARKKYPPYPNTMVVKTSHLPLEEKSVDIIFAILSAHEIRESEERVIFFKELNRILKPSGIIVITEHIRDLNNFLAYNIGFFHFLSKKSWTSTFTSAGLEVEREIKNTPFVTTFVLKKHGGAS